MRLVASTTPLRSTMSARSVVLIFAGAAHARLGAVGQQRDGDQAHGDHQEDDGEQAGAQQHAAVADLERALARPVGLHLQRHRIDHRLRALRARCRAGGGASLRASSWPVDPAPSPCRPGWRRSWRRPRPARPSASAASAPAWPAARRPVAAVAGRSSARRFTCTTGAGCACGALETSGGCGSAGSSGRQRQVLDAQRQAGEIADLARRGRHQLGMAARQVGQAQRIVEIAPLRLAARGSRCRSPRSAGAPRAARAPCACTLYLTWNRPMPSKRQRRPPRRWR